MSSEIIYIPDDDNDDDDDRQPPNIDRRAILTPIITRVVNALGGFENESSYRLGDEVYACLKDLKKLWRKDDTDDDRTVARIFWETRVLPNDLVPILMVTAGKGLVDDKRAIACVDLMTAMTWPIDMAEELKELDEEFDKNADYTQLLASHLAYKAALMKPDVMKALFGIMLPPLAKTPKERVEKDAQIMNVVLHLIRNLAFIKDPAANSLASADQAELSKLQSKLIRTLEETNVLQLLLMIAANTDNDPLFNGWNTLVLEIFYLLFRGVKPETLAQDQAKEPAAHLQRLLAVEDRNRREVARKASSRHSRFGTTISVRLNPAKPQPPSSSTPSEVDNPDAPGKAKSRAFVLHKQQAIHAETTSIMDMTKRQKAKKATTVDALAQDHNLSLDARMVLQELAGEFLEGCFNPFLSGLLKDIRSEKAKITEKDNLRLLYVTKWFLEYFLTMQGKQNPPTTTTTAAASSSKSKSNDEQKWKFGLIAEVTERVWIVWVLKRMREAMEEKPKLWTELQAGVECLTQLLLLIDRMSSSPLLNNPNSDHYSEEESATLSEAAEVLQQQLIYNGEVLDIALDSLRTYKEGTQSLVYLDASVHLAYTLLRMLEKWGRERGDGTYVRKRAARKKRARKGVTEEEGIPDVEEAPVEQDDDDVVDETLFTFEAFQMKFANADVATTLLTYLARYKEFASVDNMKRVVGLMHRQAVKAKAEGLFFRVSTLDLFKSILADQKSFPRDQAYKDLVSLINYVLRKFFKALEEKPFLAIEAFFPKNRSHWKQYSSWEPEAKAVKASSRKEVAAASAEVEVKKGYSWTDQMGIAIAALVEVGRENLVTWTQEILKSVIDKRKSIVDETDHKSDEEEDESVEGVLRLKGPSAEAIQKFSDEAIPYLSNDHADAATKNPHLKLLFRLCKFFLRNQDVDEDEELEWYIPQAILPSELQQSYNVIGQFLETPFDLDGKKASEHLRKKRASRRRRTRRRSPSGSGSDDQGELSDAPVRKKKKAKEQVQYKSAQFIMDSDEEYPFADEFLEKERLQREKSELAAAAYLNDPQVNRPTGMRSTGTKKKRKRKQATREAEEGGRRSPSESGAATSSIPRVSSEAEGDGSDMGSDGAERQHTSTSTRGAQNGTRSISTEASRPKPRPRPRKRKTPGSAPSSPSSSIIMDAPEPRVASPSGSLASPGEAVKHSRKAKRLVLSDSEEE